MSGPALPLRLAKGSAQHRALQVAGYGALVGLAVWTCVTWSPFQQLNLSKAMAYATALLGLNIVGGYSGQVSLGHSVFFGTGAYTTAVLVSDYDWPFVATLPVAVLIGLLIGTIVGVPALRVQGLYLALVTLAIAVAFPVLLKLDFLEQRTGGDNGKSVRIDWEKPDWFTLDVSDQGWELLVIIVLTAVLFLVASNMMRSRVGRALVALRDNPTGAAVSGVNLAAWKTGAFAVSAAFGALGGCLFTFVIPIVSPSGIGFLLAIQFLTALILGGAGSISGNLVGGLAMVFLPYYTAEWAGGRSLLFFDPADSGSLANLIYGLLLIGAIFVAPGGAVAFARALRARVVRVEPNLTGRSGTPPAGGARKASASRPAGRGAMQPAPDQEETP